MSNQNHFEDLISEELTAQEEAMISGGFFDSNQPGSSLPLDSLPLDSLKSDSLPSDWRDWNTNYQWGR